MPETVFERIPSTPPVIPPLSPDTKRLQWSVMIPVYNGLTYLEQTLCSVIAKYRNHDQNITSSIVAKDALKFQVNVYSVNSYLKLLFKFATRYQ